ncbi:MAG TPA: hypothetical protein VGC88_01225, partial [Terriglobales bacterium]
MYRLAAVLLLFALSVPSAISAQTKKHGATAHSTAKRKSAASKTSAKKRSAKKKAASRRKKLTPAQRARAARMKRAFVASSQLRPMAQQLLENRTPEAYAAVERYARAHRTENAGTMAWMAIGYARILDKQYDAAIPALQTARLRAGDLSDYADLFLAQAFSGTGQSMTAATALADFDKRHPDSILLRDAALTRADALVAAGEPTTALKALEPYRSENRADVEFSAAKAYAALGDQTHASAGFTRLYAEYPTSWQAAAAATELQKLNPGNPYLPLTVQQRITRADLLFKSRKYADAADEYRNVLNLPETQQNPDSKRQYTAKLAGAMYRSGRRVEAMSLLDQMSEQPVDEAGAERLYMKAEEARAKDDGENHRKYVDLLVSANPTSIWTQEALLSAGNMYLLRKD